jgi:hypothetical protein
MRPVTSESSVIAACLTGAIALLVLLGWTTGIPGLKSFLPNHVATQPWTAVGLLCGALALGLAALGGKPARVAPAAAVSLLATATLALLQHISGRDFGTDLLLFRDAALSAQTHSYPYPGRLGPLTALNFGALAISLLLARRPREDRTRGAVFSVLATASLLSGVLGLNDPVARFVLGQSLATFLFSLALPTATGVVLLSAGTLALPRISDGCDACLPMGAVAG